MSEFIDSLQKVLYIWVGLCYDVFNGVGNRQQNQTEVQRMATILGQHISLIRPEKVKRHSASGAWKRAKSVGRKTTKLSMEMKRDIARQMGFNLMEVAT